MSGNSSKSIAARLQQRYPLHLVQKLASALAPIEGREGSVGVDQVLSFAEQVGAGYSNRVKTDFLLSSASLLARLGWNRLADFVAIIERTAASNESAALSLIARSGNIFDSLGMKAGLTICDDAGWIAAQTPDFAVRFLDDVADHAYSIQPELVDRVHSVIQRIVSAPILEPAPLISAIPRALRRLDEFKKQDGLKGDGLKDLYDSVCYVAEQDIELAEALLSVGPELLNVLGIDGLHRIRDNAISTDKKASLGVIGLVSRSPEIIAQVSLDGFETLLVLFKESAHHSDNLSLLTGYRIVQQWQWLWRKKRDSLFDAITVFARALTGFDGDLAYEALVNGEFQLGLLLGNQEQAIRMYLHGARIAAHGPQAANGFVLGYPRLVDQLEKENLDKLALLMEDFAKSCPKAAGLLSLRLVEFTARHHASAVFRFIRHATRLGHDNVASAFVQGETTESVRFWDVAEDGLPLDSARSVLAPYLSAMCGHTVNLTAGPVSFDGNTMYLPDRISGMPRREDNFLLYKALATHEAAHFLYGTPEIDSYWFDHQGAALGGEARLQRFVDPVLAMDTLLIIEDARIESRLSTELGGYAHQLKDIRPNLISQRPLPLSYGNKKQCFMEVLGQTLLLGHTPELPSALEALLSQVLIMVQPLLQPGSTAGDSVRIANKVYNQIQKELDGLYSSILLFSAPHLRSSAVSSQNQTSDGGHIDDSTTLDDGGRHQEIGEDDKRDDAVHSNPDMASRVGYSHIEDNGGQSGSAESRVFTYPEWGYDIGAYRSDWSRIVERTLLANDNLGYAAIRDEQRGSIRRVRRQFQRLRELRMQRLRRQLSGEDIDMDAVTDYFMDQAAGLSGSDGFYLHTVRRRREVAVAFLVDMSGSTRGETLDCEKAALVVMAEAIAELGDTFALFGFFEKLGPDEKTESEFHIIKGFDAPYDQLVQRRIASMEAQEGNRDGTAIRHVTTKLAARPERAKLLILLSDSQPAYEDREYGIQDTRMALKEAASKRINTFCITIDKQARDYLSRMYCHSNWVCIDDVTRLPHKLPMIYQRLTG